MSSRPPAPGAALGLVFFCRLVFLKQNDQKQSPTARRLGDALDVGQGSREIPKVETQKFFCNWRLCFLNSFLPSGHFRTAHWAVYNFGKSTAQPQAFLLALRQLSLRKPQELPASDHCELSCERHFYGYWTSPKPKRSSKPTANTSRWYRTTRKHRSEGGERRGINPNTFKWPYRKDAEVLCVLCSGSVFR